jgi:PAS domain S-box-containing protein
MMFILVFLVIWTWLLKRSVAAKTKDLHIELTERKRTEEERAKLEKAFHKEKETLSMILERTPHGISLVDNDGKYLYLNPYYTKITGYTLEDIPSKEEWFEKAYPNENYRKEIIEAWNKDILEGELEKIREFKIKCKNGDTKYIEFRSAFLKDKKISVLTDVTSRKESEKIVREKDRLQGVLELSGAVSHEMSQPLMSVLGYFDLILLDMPADDPNYSRICKIQTQLERMSYITKKLMEISRYQTKDYLDGRIYDLAGTSKTEIPNR